MGLSLSDASNVFQAAGIITNPISAVTSVLGKVTSIFGGKHKTPLQSAQQFQHDVMADLANPAKRAAALAAIQYRASPGYLASIDPSAGQVYLQTLEMARSQGLFSNGPGVTASQGTGAMPQLLNGVVYNGAANLNAGPVATGGMGGLVLIGIVIAVAFLVLRKS